MEQRDGNSIPAAPAMLKVSTGITKDDRPITGLPPDVQFMSAVFQACGTPLAVVERGRIVLANEAFAQLFAYGDTGQLVGQPLAELLPAEHPCTLAVWRGEVESPTGMARYSTRCGEQHCVFNARRRGGSFARMESSCRGLHYNGRELLVISARDISQGERRAAEREPEKRFRAIFDWAAVGIAHVNLESKIVESNPALEKMLGYGRAELQNVPVTRITYPDDIAADLELYQELIAGKREHYQIEKRYLRKDGQTIWGHLTVSLVRGPAGQPEFAIGMVEDITERKNAERELREAQRIEAVGRLVGGVAHDFNNLLTAITLYSDLLLASVNRDSPQHRHGEEIRMAADRGAALIQQLLAFVRPQPSQPEVLSVGNVVAGMKNMLARLIGEQIELLTSSEPALRQVKMDEAELQQIVLNLTLNGRDAMAEGGTLTISTRNVQIEPASLRDDPAPGAYVELAVEDTGCGIDAETRSHLFEPFFTTKPKGKGNGLGLATVRRIVLQNHGAIGVESELGRGTTVRILLPAEVAAEPPESQALESVEAMAGHETVLLVEDEAAVRESMRSVLARNGYNVIEARNGQEALNIGNEYKGKIELLITDLVLPGLGGREVARRLIQTRPRARVLYISGYSHDARMQLGRGETVFQKPFTGEALVRRVREALNQEARGDGAKGEE